LTISPKGKIFLANLEGGAHRDAYLDSGGELTIGVGHLLTLDERRSGKIWIKGEAVDYRNGLTLEQCYDLMEQDLKIAMRAVNEFVKVPLTDYQYAALVSFVFNIGVNAFAGSTLLRLLNQGAYIHVPEQMKRWIYDNGEIVQGLINRRDKEIEMWNGPQVTVAV
jgi:lysozyme